MITLEQHHIDHSWIDVYGECACGKFSGGSVNDHANHFAQTWSDARTVRTVEELDALDPGTAIASHRGQRIYRKTRDRDGWAPAGNRDTEHAELIDLPAVILWTPEDGAL